ncbi:phosphotransferase [Mycolicibacterium sp.]|uniref:phosphotransferase n=1 Tax=Mycolicibacterium sp. TaxID=2320850 RepID=UPI003D103CC2
MTAVGGRVARIAGLAAHLGRGSARLAAGAALGPRRMPRHPGELDAGAMSRIMARTVTSVSVLDADAGTSSRARLALTGTDVPDSVFVKMAARTAATRLMGELGNLAATETRFYRQLAPELDGVPTAFGSQFDPRTGRYVVVLEDLAAAGCEFPDTLHPIDADRAVLVVELLARLHARFWGRLPARSGTGPFGWLYTASEDSAALLTGRLLKVSARRLAERTELPLARGTFIDENYRAIAGLIDRPPHTVMHGDAHPGNVYFRDGRAGLLDWQAVRRGHPGRELAYTLVTGMATEQRRDTQRELLDVYRRALAAGGGPQLDRDELWLRYRQGALYPYVAALITAGMGGMQAEDIAIKGLGRSLAALADLDSVALLKAAL